MSSGRRWSRCCRTVRGCGVGSGRTTGRSSTAGDRQANSALYTITIARLRWDMRTQDYVQRRVAEGKTRREAIRCLKRYIAREVYHDITSTRAAPTARSAA